VATDGENASTTSAVVRVTVNSRPTPLNPFPPDPFGRSDTVDQGAAWRTLDFNDNAWASGPAQLGYGDNDEATVVVWAQQHQ
jgi:hypothetical protein